MEQQRKSRFYLKWIRVIKKKKSLILIKSLSLVQECNDVQDLPRDMFLCCQLWLWWSSRGSCQWDCPLLLWWGRPQEGQLEGRGDSREQVFEKSGHWWISSSVVTDCFTIHLLPTRVSIIGIVCSVVYFIKLSSLFIWFIIRD